ncbi:hypothetical protein KBB96_04215 [Luteolibacter ambystomatis]|uniref:Uncharacterized protein n=1 Tax=Luteolibacter ambystomatis TaxID=2824561 RepID=A0A975J140_9BACT|nr:hypothetical protein [Luteolibacter ambystomatis]QUE52098.1 hypothetical protein KBB96_04215 [Luteolibacter ambystomatis]
MAAWLGAMQFVAGTAPVNPPVYGHLIKLPCCCCSGRTVPDRVAEIVIHADGRVFLDKMEAGSLDDPSLLLLSEGLREIRTHARKPQAWVMMENGVYYQQLMDVLDILAVAEIPDYQFSME